jgi:nucleoside-diphosphate-sugar epimerase
MEAVELFDGRTGRHVFISSGQVYLVRDGAGRPFREEEYDGPVVDEPSAGSSDYESWKYGVDKRAAEDVFAEAWTTRRFPVTTLRLPMVASERDHYGRIQGYLGRIEDGGPILVPDEEGLPLRHVYADDVARLVAGLATARAGIGRAFNISFGESMLLSQYLELLGQATGNQATVFRVPRSVLEREELLPDCSPFSGKWMSELDNARSLTELAGAGMAYTAPAVYLPRLVEDYRARWAGKGILSPGYVARGRELRFASSR